jgi:NifB/MoaA-like Fe-S oxidoreductase
MGPLMPQVLAELERAAAGGEQGGGAGGGRFEIVALENTLFGSAVTTAGLLPGTAIRDALRARPGLDLALLPAEALNDDLVFIDDISAKDLAAAVPMPIWLSYDFVDAVEAGT